MLRVDVDIIGPGLVVNGPALLILRGLRDLGYKVECQEWLGFDQWKDGSKSNQELEDFAKKRATDITVRVNVKPMPWGG